MGVVTAARSVAGRGKVRWGFYKEHVPVPETANGLTGANDWVEPCRSCGGAGVLWR